MRSEIKYLVPEALLPQMRRDLAPFVDIDRHCLPFPGRGYTVRSLYLDTATLRYYHEKKAGLQVRRKLRLRAYNQHLPGSWVFLEVKRKIDDKTFKNRAPSSMEKLGELFRTGDIEHHIFQTEHYPNAFEDARRFFYHVYRYDLAPTFMTVYEREAFVGRAEASLRITFDRNLRGRAYPQLTQLYEDEGLRHVRPLWFILEVKYDVRVPAWLRVVLGRYNLRQQALSKYCLCGEIVERQNDSAVKVLSSTQVMS